MDSNTLEGASRAIDAALPQCMLDASRAIAKHTSAVEPRRCCRSRHGPLETSRFGDTVGFRQPRDLTACNTAHTTEYLSSASGPKVHSVRRRAHTEDTSLELSWMPK